MADFKMEFNAKFNVDRIQAELKSQRLEIEQGIVTLETLARMRRKKRGAETTKTSGEYVVPADPIDAHPLISRGSVSKSPKLGPILTRLGLLAGLFVKPSPTIEQSPEGENDYVDLLEATYKKHAGKRGEVWAKAHCLINLAIDISLSPLGKLFAAWEAIRHIFR